mmetsp:Transcript_33798/g.80215  ORF Transcript_33798/g.80215 Transcript_33798/m.80215 type:complete len:200 (-) Transcript_33798:332-931(-)
MARRPLRGARGRAHQPQRLRRPLRHADRRSARRTRRTPRGQRAVRRRRRRGRVRAPQRHGGGSPRRLEFRLRGQHQQGKGLRVAGPEADRVEAGAASRLQAVVQAPRRVRHRRGGSGGRRVAGGPRGPPPAEPRRLLPPRRDGARVQAVRGRGGTVRRRAPDQGNRVCHSARAPDPVGAAADVAVPWSPPEGCPRVAAG